MQITISSMPVCSPIFAKRQSVSTAMRSSAFGYSPAAPWPATWGRAIPTTLSIPSMITKLWPMPPLCWQSLCPAPLSAVKTRPVKGAFFFPHPAPTPPAAKPPRHGPLVLLHRFALSYGRAWPAHWAHATPRFSAYAPPRGSVHLPALSYGRDWSAHWAHATPRFSAYAPPLGINKKDGSPAICLFCLMVYVKRLAPQ